MSLKDIIELLTKNTCDFKNLRWEDENTSSLLNFINYYENTMGILEIECIGLSPSYELLGTTRIIRN